MKIFKVLIIFLAVVALSGCKYKTLSEQLTIDKQTLTSQLSKSDSTLKAYQSFMKEAVSKLNALVGAEVAEGQQMAAEDLPARLDKAIADIAASLQQTQQKYKAASGRYASANSKVKALEAEVNDLKILVDQKDSLINILNEKSASLATKIEDQSVTIDEIKGKNSELENNIVEITGNLNTAWYTTGTVADLMEKNVIIKTGGFLGMCGRVKVLSPAINSGSLEKIDIREKTTFELKCSLDDVEFISHHHSGSYQLRTVDSETVSLTITDTAKFWEASRYLVIAY
jgi:multidrug efflux pump subunit AcrA (membrane-fusion protein)